MPSINQLVTINSRKFDGKIHKSWTAELLNRKDCLLTFIGEFDKEIKHPRLGVIGRGTISYEFYWLNEWFNVFQFFEKDGSFRNFYCNLNLPPNFENGILDYVDLDLDVLVWKDFSIEILDVDEYIENRKKFNYSAEIVAGIEENLNKLIGLIINRKFPFDLNL